MSKFKVGDKVRVIDGGRHLNTDDRFMKAYAPNLLDKWRNGKYYDTMGRTQDVVGTVIAVGEIEKVLVSDAIGELFVIYEYGLSLEPIRREFIVIRRSGAETIAELRHDREVIKSAKATCAPSDTFDLDTGAKLAFDRLMGREEPKRESLADVFEQLTGRAAPVLMTAPEPQKFFSVGDRVVTSIGAGYIKQVDVNSESLPYYISYDMGVTLWHRSDEAKLEPPKFYTGKVFACDSQDTMFRKRDGYIFEFSNGLCVNARPDQSIPTFNIFRDIAEIRKRMSLTTWHEVKSDV